MAAMLAMGVVAARDVGGVATASGADPAVKRKRLRCFTPSSSLC